ncbi:hypothetical protein WJX74_004852 [Apatococcus lobatus]|uniref:PPPDE domain-containing protein n=1 Tax=Apatococcus lobatus TaxID=904363 RepID=A0AAW1Q8Z6_9CHLO
MPSERKVLLHVYDCTTTASGAASPAIARLNAVTRELWLGGIFHGAVELEHTGREWSFGYCPEGSGVYDCPAKLNPLYRFRESIVLGSTSLGLSQVSLMICQLQRLWQGTTYDLLARNCCHFCEQFSVQLGGSKLPGWLNRFANAADSALSWTQAAHQQSQFMQVAGSNSQPPLDE